MQAQCKVSSLDQVTLGFLFATALVAYKTAMIFNIFKRLDLQTNVPTVHYMKVTMAHTAPQAKGK